MRTRENSHRQISISLVVLGAVCLSSRPVIAQPADKAAAEAVFDEAKRLMTAGKFADACPKFAESYRLDPGVGVLLYMGDCYEKNGQTASAWAAFREAEAGARAAGQAEREKVARGRSTTLEPKLNKLTITVAPASDLAGLELRRDGALVGRALWGSAIPVDPGTRLIEATAPGHKKWSASIELASKQLLVTMNVPPLVEEKMEDKSAAPLAAAPSGAPIATESTPPYTGSPGSSQKTIAIITGAAGVIGIGVGAVFGAKTFSSWSTAKENCHGSSPILCNPQGVSAASDASTAGVVSTIGFVGGGVLLAGAAALWFTAPKGSAPRVGAIMIAPAIGPGLEGAVLKGAF